MSIVGFNFTSITAKRSAGKQGKLSINNETKVTDVKEITIGKQKALQFEFSYHTVYEPGIADLGMTGEVIMLESEKDVKDTLASYKKTKTFSPELTEQVYNAILTRTSFQALLLARELDLPSPIKLPRVELKKVETQPEPKKK